MIVAGNLAAGGLIPAHAGKTIARLSSGPCARAHPRSRGENATSGQSWGLGVAHPRSRGENKGTTLLERHVDGSSPLTRGKREKETEVNQSDRLIPAHAGKTGR